MNLILESGRDDMLKIYHQLVISKGINISFGAFKSILLEHLTQNAGIRNLSLSSNYYLAGVAKYYFNGDLTENKDLALFHNYLTNAQRTQMTGAGETFEQNHEDIWKTDICTKLNVLIKILRDSYIDSVGTKFEIPEDFGNLPIKKLLSKYNSKIKKALGIEVEEVPNEPEIDSNPNVGNGYTFEIMYCHEDCKKYYDATNPGAWCITYGENHYNSYANGNWSTGGRKIHYVIFRKNGWENVERVPDKKMWKQESANQNPRPQDEYGNSLIAMLQSNDSWEPICITSRWNHGAGDSGPVEADHAYSTEEFMRITGVNQDDLERIYQIWKHNYEKYQNGKKLTSKEKKAKILALKEIQIRLNGGASPDSLLSVEEIIVGNHENLRKSVFIGSVKNSRENFFIVDKCKIIFETLNEPSTYNFLSTQDWNNLRLIQNMVFCDFGTYYIAYDYRRHSILNIDGVYKFKSVPTRSANSDGNPMFYEVKTSNRCIALVSVTGNIPLKLPNGSCWFNEIFAKSRYTSFYSHRNKVSSFFVGDDSNGMIEIIYDSSSREKYFYLLQAKRFITFDKFENDVQFPEGNEKDGDEPVIGDCTLGRNYFAIQYCDRRWTQSRWCGNLTPIQLYRIDGSRIIVNGVKYFYSVKYLGNDFFSLAPFEDGETYDVCQFRYDEKIPDWIYNAVDEKIYTINGQNLSYNYAECSGYAPNPDNGRVVFFQIITRNSNDYYYLFDKVEKKFIYNTYDYPTEFTFKKRSALKEDGSHMSFFKDMSGRADYSYDNAQDYVFFVDVVEGITYETDTRLALYSYGEHEYDKIEKKNIRPIKYVD